MNLPIEYESRMKAILKDEFDSYYNSLNEKPVRAFRVNTDKISVEEYLKINNLNIEKIPYVSNGFYFTEEKVGDHPFHNAGIIYVQEPAAMAPVESVDIDPSWTVLDMCASPGGKSSQIRNKLDSKSVLVSNEISPSRCKILTGNIERLGFTNTITTCADSSRIAKAFPDTFDLICVDAPCSGEGMLRKEVNALSNWSLENVKISSERQREILDNAAVSLKDGGYIVYSTCTFSIEENEMNIDWFIRNHPEFELIPVKSAVKAVSDDGIFFEGCSVENINECRRFYPHKNRGEGQFVAVLKNKSNFQGVRKEIKTCLKKADNKVLTKFLEDTLMEFNPNAVYMYKDVPVYFDSDFSVPSGIAFSCGVTIGEIKKNYILPHHQFYMAMGNRFKRQINLKSDSLELIKYLHGETIPSGCKNGFTAVLCEGCTTGGGKTVDGQLKNHYPKGLRVIKSY